MPELPEVETIRRQLAPAVEGRVLAALEIADPRWCLPLDPGAVRDAVEGRRIERLGRRGKYLVLELEGDVFLMAHLRMTGTMLYDPPAGTPYERARFSLDDGHEVRFCDPRRFGTGELAVGGGALEAFFAARLGIEPLGEELTGAVLRRLARHRRAPVKAFLLDQRRIAGVGNIYADEALFRARIHPLRAAGASRARSAMRWPARCATRSRPAWPQAARRSTTSATPTACGAASRTSSSCTGGRASRARRAAGRSASSWSAGEEPTSASAASLGRVGDEPLEPARPVCGRQLAEAAEHLAVDDDLREAHHARLLRQLHAAVRVLCEIDLLVGQAAAVEQLLGARAERAGIGRVHEDLGHYFT